MRSCQGQLQAWLESMAPYVKGLDPNHLLSIGEEGFYSTADVARGASDPGGAESCALSRPLQAMLIPMQGFCKLWYVARADMALLPAGPCFHACRTKRALLNDVETAQSSQTGWAARHQPNQAGV